MRHLSAAVAVAMSSPGTGKRDNYRVGAVLFNGKTVYAAKHNQLKTHTKLARYSSFPFLHAESSCILSHGISNCHGLDLLCVRITAKGKLTMSKPCEACTTLISESGIRRVYYSNWEGVICRL